MARNSTSSDPRPAGASLVGQTYGKALVRRSPARAFPCALCTHRAASWDHCHAHGIIRGALCATCNRVMVEVDAGLAYRPREPLAWDLVCLGGPFHTRHRPVWSEVELFAGPLRTYAELLDYRATCPQCTTDPPPRGAWVDPAAARSTLAGRLMDAGSPGPCAWCLVVQTVHGVPVNPDRRRGDRSRRAAAAEHNRRATVWPAGR